MSERTSRIRGAVAQGVLCVTGLWLMAAPGVLGYANTPAGESDRFSGPMIASLAFLGIFQITRGVRWASLPFGAWLLVAPWVLGHPVAGTISALVSGVVVLALAPVGSIDQGPRYGGGWASLWHPERLPRVPADADARHGG